MHGKQEVTYRLKVAQGFLAECQQDLVLQRWRSAVDNGQLTIEHATKAVLATLGPVGRTHNPSTPLHQAHQENKFATALSREVQRLAELATLMGRDLHIQTDYGDETSGLTPWELFDETDAQQALAMAEEAVALDQTIIGNDS